VELLTTDPLTDPFGLPRVARAFDAPILLVRDDQGEEINVPVHRLGHIAVQGQTGSGKSVFVYSILSQLASRLRAGFPLSIGGIDPSGILLRPFPRSILGLTDPGAVEGYLTEAVADMDRRIAAIPLNRDVLDITPDFPLRFVVLEEVPALYRWIDAVDTKAGKRVRALIARLLAEGRKACIRVVLIAQRAEAAILGGSERAQCSLRVSFRSDTVESVRLLHPDADPDQAAMHSTALPGVALLSMPGRGLTRGRAPWISYARYVDGVSA
jgi:S-DNA-T family DNA segregation ATPase FtsK/SpoIIIE